MVSIHVIMLCVNCLQLIACGPIGYEAYNEETEQPTFQETCELSCSTLPHKRVHCISCKDILCSKYENDGNCRALDMSSFLEGPTPSSQIIALADECRRYEYEDAATCLANLDPHLGQSYYTFDTAVRNSECLLFGNLKPAEVLQWSKLEEISQGSEIPKKHRVNKCTCFRVILLGDFYRKHFAEFDSEWLKYINKPKPENPDSRLQNKDNPDTIKRFFEFLKDVCLFGEIPILLTLSYDDLRKINADSTPSSNGVCRLSQLILEVMHIENKNSAEYAEPFLPMRPLYVYRTIAQLALTDA